MAIDMYVVHAKQKREEAAAAYISSPEFQQLEQEAGRRGFRKASIGEINVSAESAHGALDLYMWRGGLWVKCSHLSA